METQIQQSNNGGHAHVHSTTNSHILVNEFEFHEPATIEEATHMLAKYGSKAQILAGGTHLLIMMKMEREAPEAVININKIPELNKIEINQNGELVIGSRVTIRALRDLPLIRERYTALSDSCAAFGSTQIEIMGTIGGNVCNGSPASDTIPALLVFNARLLLQNSEGSRIIDLKDFLIGPSKTAMKPGELLVSIILPPLPANAVSSFYKMSRVSADLAKASVAVVLTRDEEQIGICRIAYGSLAPTCVRAYKAEEMLSGQPFSNELIKSAASTVVDAISPIDDIRSTAWYRRQVASVMLIDTINAIWPSADNRVVPTPLEPGIIQDSLSNGHITYRHQDGEEQQEILLVVNGTPRKVWVNSNELLLNTLRWKLQLTGTKYGCGVGECSACAVMVDEKPNYSCLLLSVAVDGKHITTIEGLQRPDGSLDPLQQAFIDYASFQCGYCTPGFLMTLKGLLNENPTPSEDEVRDYVKGNRCRCTGYSSIVRAVMALTQNESN